MLYSHTCDNCYIAIFELYTIPVLLTEYEEKWSSFQYYCECGNSLHQEEGKKNPQNPQCNFPLKTCLKKKTFENTIWSKAILYSENAG